jgi:hypothetical protein
MVSETVYMSIGKAALARARSTAFWNSVCRGVNTGCRIAGFSHAGLITKKDSSGHEKVPLFIEEANA